MNDTETDETPGDTPQAPAKTPIRYLNDAKTGTSLDLATGTQSELRDSRTGRFVKGHAPLAGGGRPKKGERLLHYVERLVEKPANKQAAAEAHLDRLLRRDAVGARAFADHRDTFEGVPHQTLVVRQGQTAANELDAELAAYIAARTVDGEARVLPADDIT